MRIPMTDTALDTFAWVAEAEAWVIAQLDEQLKLDEEETRGE